MPPLIRLALLLVIALLPACAGIPSHSELARTSGMEPFILSGRHFDVLTYQRGEGAVLHVYIEGDGKAWRNRRQPSSDPTPDNPIGLRMAVADHHAVLYLARPCQYVEGENRRNCDVPLWTSARFAEPVIDDMNAVLDQAKTRARASSVRLIGYSGGGAIAMLLANRRDDVELVVTVAGNMDHAYWTTLHGVSPLRDSLNPADKALSLQSIPQLHIVSRDDDVMPPSVVFSYVGKMADSSKVRVIVIDGMEHTGDWHEVVPGILDETGVW